MGREALLGDALARNEEFVARGRGGDGEKENIQSLQVGGLPVR